VPVAAAVWAVAWLTPVAPGAFLIGAGLAGAAACGWLLARGRRPRAGEAGRTNRRSRGNVWVVIACLLAAVAAGLATEARARASQAGPLPGLAEQRAIVSVQVRIIGYPQVHTARARHGPARPTVSIAARAERVLGRGKASRIRSPVLLQSTDLTWRRVVPGERYALSGRLAAGRAARDPVVLWSARAGTRLDRASWPHRWAAAVRADLQASVAGLPAGPRALVPGLVVGDTSAVDPAATAEFKVSGLTHLTAVSGANVAILLVVVLGLAGRLGLPRRLWPVLGGAAVLGFLLVVGPAPSLLRAAAMGAVGLLGLAIGRPTRAVPALCTAVVLLLLADPALARSYSFALSTVATAALIGLAPRWRDAFARHLPRPVATALAVPAAAQVACAPLIVLLSGNISLVAVVANLLVAPVVAPAMICGLLAAATQPVSPPLAALLARPAGACAAWILAVAHHCAALPGATLPWPDGPRGAVLLAGLTVLALLVVHRAAAPARPGLLDGPADRVRRRRGLIVALAVLVGALLVRPPLPVPTVLRPGVWPPAGWQLVACDVGQGDGLVLHVAPGTAVVVDAGPDPAPMDRCLRRLGVHRVPFLLLTHFHADHVEGLPGVLRGRRVGLIQVSPLDDPPEEVARVQTWAARAGVPVIRARPGEVRSVGGLRWRVLWPTTLLAGDSPPNNASVVLRAVTPAGLSLLLAGDIEPLAQAVLHRAEPDLRAQVLKVPHHGSSHQDDEFLRSLQAKVALVSVGADNGYGHPAQRTLDLLRGIGATTLRTDTGGDLAVAVQDGRLRVAARSGSGGGPGRVPAAAGTTPAAEHRRRRVTGLR
jgi:competence protein ComEC